MLEFILWFCLWPICFEVTTYLNLEKYSKYKIDNRSYKESVGGKIYVLGMAIILLINLIKYK